MDFRRVWRTSRGALILARSRQKAAKLTKVHDHADGGRLDNVEVPVKIGRSMSSLGTLKHGPQQPKPRNGPSKRNQLGLLARSTNAEASADLPDFFGPFQSWRTASVASVEQYRCLNSS
ncbi:hypothetical protein, partial [Burkholderia pseudomallei]|uniref:hypothetical protein n=3 Tax=Burkholderia pseudomallei TaxID=28450 RepID=UPI001C834D74